MRIAIYTRVSTTDKGQTVENQVRAIRIDCDRREEPIVLEESDVISGTKRIRPGLDRILAAAERHEFDVLVVWSLDRLTREGAFRALEIIQQLTKLGIGFRSIQEIHFDTCGPFKDAIIAIAATLAKLEREKIVERVKAGLERTKAEGTVLGRPNVVDDITRTVIEMRSSGLGPTAIAAAVHIITRSGATKNPGVSTIRKILAQHKDGSAAQLSC